MSDKRRALGRGLGALIPQAPTSGAARPVDVFFSDGKDVGDSAATDQETPPREKPTQGEASVAKTANTALTSENTAMDTDHTVAEEVARASSEQPAPAGPMDRTASLTPVPGAEFAELSLDAITPNAKQPRTVFDEDDLAELVHSIKEIGVLQPIVVRPLPAGGSADPRVKYELIMGERRWRASREAGHDTVPAIVKSTADDDMLRDALLENLHRSQLNALEEAAAYQQLLDDFGCTQEVLATRIGRSRPQISNTLRLLRLPPLVARRVAAGVLSAGHARALLALPDPAAMERMAQKIVSEGLSVRGVEELVALGDHDEATVRRKPRAGNRHPQLDEFASSLSDRLDTRVRIALGARKGRVTVEFASVEDLHRILRQMGVDRSGDS